MQCPVQYAIVTYISFVEVPSQNVDLFIVCPNICFTYMQYTSCEWLKSPTPNYPTLSLCMLTDFGNFKTNIFYKSVHQEGTVIGVLFCICIIIAFKDTFPVYSSERKIKNPTKTGKHIVELKTAYLDKVLIKDIQ